MSWFWDTFWTFGFSSMVLLVWEYLLHNYFMACILTWLLDNLVFSHWHSLGFHFIQLLITLCYETKIFSLRATMSSAGRALRAKGSWGSAAAGKWVHIIFPHFFLPFHDQCFYSPSTVPLLTSDYTQEQELQVFPSTQRKALKKSVKEWMWFLCLWVSSYQVRWASPATLHCSLIRPLPWSVTDHGDLALSPPPKSCSQTLNTGPWCVGITDTMLRHSAESDFGSGTAHQFCSPLMRFLSTREHSNTTYGRGMGTGADCSLQLCLIGLVLHAVVFFIASAKPWHSPFGSPLPSPCLAPFTHAQSQLQGNPQLMLTTSYTGIFCRAKVSQWCVCS